MLKYLMYLTMLGGMAACSSAPSPTQEQLNAWAEFRCGPEATDCPLDAAAAAKRPRGCLTWDDKTQTCTRMMGDGAPAQQNYSQPQPSPVVSQPPAAAPPADAALQAERQALEAERQALEEQRREAARQHDEDVGWALLGLGLQGLQRPQPQYVPTPPPPSTTICNPRQRETYGRSSSCTHGFAGNRHG